VDDVRNFLFGPPGAGGLDLAALNIQRGRDHGLPDYRALRGFYQINAVTTFDTITLDADLRQSLQAVYANNINNIDPWIGGLAEDHLQGSSLGRLFDAILRNQFTRTRDGDRLFYLSNAAGLYTNGVLNPDIAAILDLNSLRLSDIIEANTGVAGLQNNVFFSMLADFDGNGVVDHADLAQWSAEYGGQWTGGGDDGIMDGTDFLLWQRQLGVGKPAQTQSASAPEPATALLALCVAGVLAQAGRLNRAGG
jgi:hypothetical protein